MDESLPKPILGSMGGAFSFSVASCPVNVPLGVAFVDPYPGETVPVVAAVTPIDLLVREVIFVLGFFLG